MKRFRWPHAFARREHVMVARRVIIHTLLLTGISAPSFAQVTAGLTGTVSDETGAPIERAIVSIRHASTNQEQQARTNLAGRYLMVSVDVGMYGVEVRAPGFKTQAVADVRLEVGRTTVLNVALAVRGPAEQVTVTAKAAFTDRATFAVGQLVDRGTVDTTPLNGQHLLDLVPLAPGSTTPPQNGYLSGGNRGLAPSTINTAGYREDTANFVVNGISLSDQDKSRLLFQPTLGAVQEFRIDTSTPSAEFGRNSGAVVNLATRSGANTMHGSLFEFFRDDALDARNYFSSSTKPPFRRHLFGGEVGGPIVRNRIFFFVSYEGMRQAQGLNVNTVVPSEAERASVTDPTIADLLRFLPHANAIDSAGTARFLGVAAAPVAYDQTAVDVMRTFRAGGGLHAFYSIQFDTRTEPLGLGTTVPGFGFTSTTRRQFLTLSHTQPRGTSWVTEARLGVSDIHVENAPVARLSAAAFGIANGVDGAIGLPQINVAGAFNLGGPASLPAGRDDTGFAASGTLSHLRGNHTLKAGAEFRRFVNDNYQLDPGTFNFANTAAFLNGVGNSFSILTGDLSNHITQDALGIFVQDAYRPSTNLTVEVGLRYEWNMTPTERDSRFVVFDPSTVSLLRVGVDTDAPVYRENNANIEPRVGFALKANEGRTLLRAGYATTVQQPNTNVVLNLTANPPFGLPLTATGTVRLDDAIQLTRSTGLSPFTIQPDYRNGTVHSWNVTAQQELKWNLSATAGYMGSSGRHLPIVLNMNQPIDGARPFQALSAASPIRPGAPLGNIIETASAGRSTYSGLWAMLTRRLADGFSVTGSYTLSSSRDSNSLSSPPTRVTVQNSYDVPDSVGPSDFDARHRFVSTVTYQLPLSGNRWAEGWYLSGLVQAQSGNPVNIVTTNSSVNGIANTLRPDLTGPVRIIGSPEQWFDTSVFLPVNHFGNFPRNGLVGPGFLSVDALVGKTVKLGSAALQLRAAAFNLLNHPNFGQPGPVVGSPNFGRITSTRFYSGDLGSSRQVQLEGRFTF